ncbi:hypothetical protein D6817_05705, partial [Candidatus Pacearchaeota archaeon]
MGGSELEYLLPLPNGSYVVRLHFAEIYYNSNGARVFNISIENQTVESNFDIFSQVGADTALVKSYLVRVTDGSLNIKFAHIADNPKISAIEVFPKRIKLISKYYDGETTNLSALDPSDIRNLILEKKRFGKIRFRSIIQFLRDVDIDLDLHTNITKNRIFINSSALPELNVSATLTLNLSGLNI